MSEQQEKYITDAIEMMGKGYDHPAIEIEQERTVIQRRNGKLESVDKPAFVKISTAFKQELPEISGDALKVWIFIALSINRKTETANPGLRTISKGVNLAINTVQKCLKELEGLGLLSVDRNSRKYNIYEAHEYVSANRLDPVSNGDTAVSNLHETVSKSTQTVSPSVILNQSNQNKPDLVDGILFYGKMAKEQQTDKVEEIIVKFERGLHVNIQRSNSNQSVARRILKDGRSVDQWLTWVIQDEWRAAHLYLYANLEKVWQDFPQAFSNEVGHNPQGLEVGL